MRSVEHDATEARRLQQVLPAMRHQRSADEGDGSKAIEEAKLAEGIREIDVGIGCDPIAYRTPRHCEAEEVKLAGDLGAAIGVTRHEDGHEPGVAALDRPMCCGDLGLLA